VGREVRPRPAFELFKYVHYPVDNVTDSWCVSSSFGKPDEVIRTRMGSGESSIPARFTIATKLEKIFGITPTKRSKT
jgi:hypothetical protein